RVAGIPASTPRVDRRTPGSTPCLLFRITRRIFSFCETRPYSRQHGQSRLYPRAPRVRAAVAPVAHRGEVRGVPARRSASRAAAARRGLRARRDPLRPGGAGGARTGDGGRGDGGRARAGPRRGGPARTDE